MKAAIYILSAFVVILSAVSIILLGKYQDAENRVDIERVKLESAKADSDSLDLILHCPPENRDIVIEDLRQFKAEQAGLQSYVTAHSSP